MQFQWHLYCLIICVKRNICVTEKLFTDYSCDGSLSHTHTHTHTHTCSSPFSSCVSTGEKKALSIFAWPFKSDWTSAMCTLCCVDICAVMCCSLLRPPSTSGPDGGCANATRLAADQKNVTRRHCCRFLPFLCCPCLIWLIILLSLTRHCWSSLRLLGLTQFSYWFT